MRKILNAHIKTIISILVLLILVLFIYAASEYTSADTLLILASITILNIMVLLWITIVYFRSTELITRNTTEIQNVFHQEESLHYIYSKVEPLLPMPGTRIWAASPDFIALIYKHILLSNPEFILELGSGASSLYTALLLNQKELNAQLLSIDESMEYAEKTSSTLAQHGLTKQAKVAFSPIKQYDIQGKTHLWYDIDMDVLEVIDMLIIDGPKGSLQKQALWPAIPLLLKHLNKGALILLDDYDRRDEREIVSAWLETYPDLHLLETHATEKGTAVLIYKGKAE